MRKVASFILIFFLINLHVTKAYVSIIGVAVPTVTIGDPEHPEKLPQQLEDVYQQGAKKIIIKPGKYLLPVPVNSRSLFLLKGWKDVIISAYGVTLVITDDNGGHDAFRLEECNNVTYEGGTVLQTKEPAYQGAIKAMGKDANGNITVDWQPDKGYPVPAESVTKFPSGLNVADGVTRKLKTGVPDYYDAGMVAIGNGLFRISLHKPHVNFGVGDLILGRNGNSVYKFFLSYATNCTIKDVMLLRNGFSTIREDGGGNNHILHCTWAPGPRPEGAGQDPLVSSTADGFHSTNTNPGPDIEYCNFEGIILDDPIAIHGTFTKVISSTGTTVICDGKEKLVAGHLLRFTNEKGFIEEANAINVKNNGDKTFTVTIDRVLNIPPDAKFSDVLQCGPGAKIIGCHIGGTRSRGILLKGDNGLIKDNVFNNCGMAAISLGPEFYWNEANYTQNVTIVGNTFIHNGNTGGGGGAIFVHGEGALGNKNIIIKNNHMRANIIPDIYLEWTDGVTISGNDMTGIDTWPETIPPISVISIKNARNISLLNNTLSNAAVYKQDIIAIGQNVNGITNNYEKGIKIRGQKNGK